MIVVTSPERTRAYVEQGWWGDLTVADYVARNAQTMPDATAYVSDGSLLTWREYDKQIDELATALAALLPRGARYGMLLPDGGEFHVALCAAERSGTVALGLSARSGRDEIRHLMSQSGAEVLVMRATHRDRAALDYVADLREDGWHVATLIIVDAAGPVQIHRFVAGETVTEEVPHASLAETRERAAGPNELTMLNSTSGTTGRPKLVTQFPNRLIAFAKMAFAAADFTGRDVMLGAVPGPFGFGQWTAHYATAMLGMKTVLMEKFTTDRMIELIGEEQVTVLACVSTQFRMMLAEPGLESAPLGSLRVMFTGGEAVPYDRALQFEERVGAKVLQFYGSNESGAISHTSLTDTAEQRLGTAGRVIDVMNLRLYDDAGNDVTATGGPGRPGVSGPTICQGYFGDPGANEELYHDDHLMMPDLVTVDADGYLRVVGRTSDLIIRGGKNISAVEVEELVESHPSVGMASAVPVPDEVFGERIGVAATVADQQCGLTLAELTAFLAGRGISKHLYPERLVIVDELPQSAGGKVAKGVVRELVAAQRGPESDLRSTGGSGGTRRDNGE